MSKKRKIYNPLRLIRQSVAVICLLLFVVAFADWGNGTPTIDQLHTIASALAGWQFVPAILSVSGTTIVLLLLLTLLVGRIYCSVLCPLGVAQDAVNTLRNNCDKKAATRFAYRKADNWLRYSVLAVMALGIAIGIGVVVVCLIHIASLAALYTTDSALWCKH